MVATTEWIAPIAPIAPTDPRWRADFAATGGGDAAAACALVTPSTVEPEEAAPAIAIFSLPEVADRGMPSGSGEPHRRLRWVGWIRRRVIHGRRVL